MTCTVIPFPTAKRVGKIRHTAILLSERSGKGADHYWQQVVKGMRSQMVSAQIEEDAIDRELRAFADCVYGQIRCMGGRMA